MTTRVRCPRCGAESDYAPSNPYRPFCSKRCKESDLYSWLSDEKDDEKNVVPPDDEADSGDPPLLH